MKKKQYAVIGMGRFGTSLARTLCRLGQEVLAIDRDEERVNYVAPEVTHAMQADITDSKVLQEIGIRNFDVVVVAIGQDVQSNIMTTLLLKEMGVPYVVAKALNKLQGRILEKVGADRVVFPERDMGKRVAHNLVSPNLVDYIEITGGYRIEEVFVPKWLVGKSLKECNLRTTMGIAVIFIKRENGEMVVSPDGESILLEGDLLVVVGRNEDLDKLEITG
ncbi:MAG: potassium channel family protein [Bacillota bacterium]